MRNLLLILFALLLSVPSAAAVDAGYLDATLTPYYFNVTTGSGTREHIGTIDPHVTDKTGGSVDSYLCLQSYSNSVAQDFLCGSAGNVTMPGTLTVAGGITGYVTTVDGGYGKPWDAGWWEPACAPMTCSASVTTLGTVDAGVVKAASFIGPLTGTASLATAGAANGGNCAAHTCAQGVDTSWAAESCVTYDDNLAPVDGAMTLTGDLSATGNIYALNGLCLSSPCNEEIRSVPGDYLYFYAGGYLGAFQYRDQFGSYTFTIYTTLDSRGNTWIGDSVAADTLTDSSTAIHYGPNTFHQTVMLGSGLTATACIDANTTGTDSDGACWDGADARWEVNDGALVDGNLGVSTGSKICTNDPCTNWLEYDAVAAATELHTNYGGDYTVAWWGDYTFKANYLYTYAYFVNNGATIIGDNKDDTFTLYPATISWGAGGDADFCIDVDTAGSDTTGSGWCWDHDTGTWALSDPLSLGTLYATTGVDTPYLTSSTDLLIEAADGAVSVTTQHVLISSTGGVSFADYSITDVGDIRADSITAESTTLTLSTLSNGALTLSPNGNGDVITDTGGAGSETIINSAAGMRVTNSFSIYQATAEGCIGKAACWATAGVAGCCTNQPNASGDCTCQAIAP